MKIIKQIFIALIRLPYGLFILGCYLFKMLLGYIHSIVFRNELLNTLARNNYTQERLRTFSEHNELLMSENRMYEEMTIELEELLPRKYLLLGFYNFKEKTTWGTIGEKKFTYFIYQNQSDKKFFEFPKKIINSLSDIDNWANLMCGERETFIISGHLAGEFKEFRKERNYKCAALETKTMATFLTGEYHYCRDVKQRKIYITNVFTQTLPNNGLASKAFTFLKEIAVKNNINKIYGEMTHNSDIETREKLRRFYQVNGFTINIDRGANKLDTFSLILID